jgi:hypothetical protein
MMTLDQNKQKLQYALFFEETPEYMLDENGEKVISYVDSDGTIYYEETGNTIKNYSLQESFYASISMSGGEISTQEYGIDISNYDAVLLLDKGQIAIQETSLVWFETEPTYKDADKTILDADKADYRVLAIKPSLNQLKVLLGRITK